MRVYPHRHILLRETMLTLVLLAAALVLAAPSSAGAATVIVVETEVFSSTGAGGSATVYIDPGRVRIDSNEGGTDFSIIYGEHDGRSSYLLINNRDKSYYVIDRETMMESRRQLEAQIENQRKQMQTLPQAQRKQMEAVLQQRMERMGFVDKYVTYSLVSEGVRIGEWTCVHYEGTREGSKVEEVWASDPKKMGLRPADLAVLGDMADYFEGTGQDMPAFFSFARSDDGDASTYAGFPVIVVTYRDGKRREKSQVKEIHQQETAEGFFLPPEGYARRDLDELGQ